MNTKPSDTSTIEEFIKAGATADVISYNSLSYIETLSNNLQSPIHNVINDYIDELISYSMTVEFSEEEFMKYKYKPKLLCYDIYENPEIYYILLLINNICDVKDFSKRVIKMIPKSLMSEIINFIYNSEKDTISEYNN